MTSSQKVLDKLARKDRRRAERAGADADLEWLLVNGFEALLEAALEAESASGALKFHNGAQPQLVFTTTVHTYIFLGGELPCALHLSCNTSCYECAKSSKLFV